MGVVAATLLVDEVLKSDQNGTNSLCGVTKTKISLQARRAALKPSDLWHPNRIHVCRPNRINLCRPNRIQSLPP
eukprot:6663820-Prymnesium_polylepis.1